MILSAPSPTAGLEQFFASLEQSLASLSHSDEAARVIESAVAERFRKTAQRQVAFAQPGAICVEPIEFDEALASGAVDPAEDRFVMLQGDIVLSESAYIMGSRITGPGMFAVLSATCDLVPGRREFASLLRVSPITGTPAIVSSTLQQLLSFRSRRDLYLPPLPYEDPPSLGYAIRFDGIAQIRLEDLLVSQRVASLTLVGWRIFGSFARILISRAGESEALLRSKLNCLA